MSNRIREEGYGEGEKYGKINCRKHMYISMKIDTIALFNRTKQIEIEQKQQQQ